MYFADEYDKYMVVSFLDSTIVFSIGEAVEEAHDTGFYGNEKTLAVGILASGAVVQVHETGVRLITGIGRPEHERQARMWQPQSGKRIAHASLNRRQVAVACSGGELHYFELDELGALTERATVTLDSEITALDVGEVPEGRLRSPFLAVGEQGQVTIRSLDPNEFEPLREKGSQAVDAVVESVCLAYVETRTAEQTLMLAIGLQNGVLQRVAVDVHTGDLVDTPRVRFAGSLPVKLARVVAGGKRAILAMSSRSWVLYSYQGDFHTSPLS